MDSVPLCGRGAWDIAPVPDSGWRGALLSPLPYIELVLVLVLTKRADAEPWRMCPWFSVVWFPSQSDSGMGRRDTHPPSPFLKTYAIDGSSFTLGVEKVLPPSLLLGRGITSRVWPVSRTSIPHHGATGADTAYCPAKDQAYEMG